MGKNLRVHIVHAHPEPKSFVAAMRDVIATQFEETGHRTTISDLYVKRFNPVASAQDFLDRSREDHLVYPLEQRYCYPEGNLSPDISDEVEHVLRADLLVFTFPLFWFGVPAILKGWIDRVFVSGLFYGGKRIYANGGLRGKRAFAAFSLGGRPHMFGPNGIHGELATGMLRHFFQGTLGYVGLEVLEPYIAYHVPYVTKDARRDMLAELGECVAKIDSRPVMSMPDLRRFNDTFEPIKAAV